MSYVCVSAYFLRLGIFIVHRFLALCMGVVMDRFVPLAFTAFLWGELPPWRKRKKRKTTRKKRSYYHLPKMLNSRHHSMTQGLLQTWIPWSLHHALVSIPILSGQERLQSKMHPHCQPPVSPSK